METVVAGLRGRVLGQRVGSARLLSRQLKRANPHDFADRVTGRVIEAVRRRGKQIVIELSDGWVLWGHLMMTGKLLLLELAEPETKFDRAMLVLHPLGKKLVFHDPRKFGRLKVMRKEQLPSLKEYARLGPDALQVSAEEFVYRLKARKRTLKALLLDQAVVAGLGNIYADESLFEAGIHPEARSDRLSKNRLLALHGAVRRVLGRAIRAGGSSIRDYSGVDGRKGFFQMKHQVYQKTGEPCPVCGTKIKRIVVAQRATHFCPCCQRK